MKKVKIVNKTVGIEKSKVVFSYFDDKGKLQHESINLPKSFDAQLKLVENKKQLNALANTLCEAAQFDAKSKGAGICKNTATDIFKLATIKYGASKGMKSLWLFVPNTYLSKVPNEILPKVLEYAKAHDALGMAHKHILEPKASKAGKATKTTKAKASKAKATKKQVAKAIASVAPKKAVAKKAVSKKA